jgi:hypothetical protein
MRASLRKAAAAGTVVPALVLVVGAVAIGERFSSSGPRPRFMQTPPRSTPVTVARFRYRTGRRHLFYRCRLDARAYRRCGNSIRYTQLSRRRHAFCVRSVSRAGKSSKPACFRWTVTRRPLLPLTIGGSPRGLLYPGGREVPVDLKLSNPNRVSIVVTSVTITVKGSSAAGCDSADIVESRPLSARPIVPPKQTRTLSELGIPESEWPALRMIDRGNQDACRGAVLQLSFQGTAVR